MEHRVRQAGPEDVAELRRLFAAANEEHRAQVPAVIYRNYLRNLVELVAEEPPAGVLVIDDERSAGRLLATGTIVPDGSSLHAAWPPRWWVLRAMAVDPAARGRGAGRALASACLERARSAGAVAVGLHTGPFMVDATRLYGALGFRRAPAHDARIDDLFGPTGEPYDELALAFGLPLDLDLGGAAR